MTCTNPWPLTEEMNSSWFIKLFRVPYLEQHDPFFPCNLSFDCSKTSLQLLTPSHHFFSFSRHNCYRQNTARRKPTSGANSDSEAEESSNSSHENQLNYRSPPSSYMCISLGHQSTREKVVKEEEAFRSFLSLMVHLRLGLGSILRRSFQNIKIRQSSWPQD